MAIPLESATLRRTPRYATAKAETMASFAAFTRGEIQAPRYPLEVFLEVSNLCNAKCVMCTVFSAFNPDRLDLVHADQRKHMLQIDRILGDEELLSHALYLHLYGFGEPTIHPRFPELVRRAAEFELAIDFFTNGMKLDDTGLVDTLIDAQVERVVLSFSGSTRELYENVYQGCSWDKVLGGLRALARRKQERGSHYPQLEINSLAWAHHLETLDEFVTLMAEHGASAVHVKQLVPYDHIAELAPHVGRPRTENDLERITRARSKAEQHGVALLLNHGLDQIAPGPAPAANRMPVEQMREHAATVELRRARPEPLPRPLIASGASDAEAAAQLTPSTTKPGFHCMEPFKTLYVRQSGYAKPCCFMHDMAASLGDVTAVGGVAVWRGSGFRALRSGALESTYPELGCGSCLRHSDGPPTHFAEQMFARFAGWYNRTLGEPLAASTGLVVADSTTVGALAAAFAALEQARVASGRRTSPVIEGYLDPIHATSVNGWAWVPKHPELRVPISIRHNGRLIAKVVADQDRPDVAAAGRGDGRYGFSCNLPAGLALAPGDVVSATAGADEQPLGQSPQRVTGGLPHV